MVTASTTDRYVAIIPGIMGSTLSYGDQEIWSSNIVTNYRRLSRDPDLLRWTGTKANAELWKTIHFSPIVPVFTMKLWRKTLNYLAAHPNLKQNRVIECPYDWRQSLQESSLDIVRRVEKTIGRSLKEDPGSHTERVAFLTHSMGSLAIRVAIGMQNLHPRWIDRIIHMAPPLRGAPVAFRSLISKTTLPFLNELLLVTHLPYYHRFVSLLFDSFQKFDSIYELLPPSDNEFLVDGATKRSSPLKTEWFDPAHVQRALQTHVYIERSHTILSSASTPVYSIYTKFHTKTQTDFEYLASLKTRRINLPWSIQDGDGTVPAGSADGAAIAGLVQLPIVNVPHMNLPNDQRAVKRLPSCGL